MKELHALVDYENVQPSLEALAKLAPGLTDVWLFHGPHQTKQAQAFAASHARVTLVPRSGQGPNALDFHVAFYLGYVAAKHPDAELVVVANDRGYDPMLAHARMLKFRARRVGYKAPVAKKAAVVKPALPAVAPVVAKKALAKKVVAKKAAAKQAAPKPAAPAKAAASKASAPSASTMEASIAAQAKRIGVKVTVAPVKKARVLPAKSLPSVRKTAASKAALSQPPQPASAPQATPEAKTMARIQQGFIKMGSKAPQKVKPFLRHVGALLGKDSTAEQIDAMVAKLEAAGAVWFIGDEVVYGRK